MAQLCAPCRNIDGSLFAFPRSAWESRDDVCRPTRWRQGGAAPLSSQRVGRAGLFEASGDAHKYEVPPAILLTRRYCLAVQPTPEVGRRQPLPCRESSFCLLNLPRADEANHEDDVYW